MQNKFFVSLIGMNRVAGTKECVDTLLRIRSPDVFLHLTNNGSTDGTGAYFDEVAAAHPNVEVVHNTENKFFQQPGEVAYAKAVARGFEFFILNNDDLLPYPGMFETLSAPFKDPMVAITGPTGGCFTLSPEFHGYGGNVVDYVEGSLMFFRISIMQKIRPKLFWNRLKRIYGEDSESSLIVKERGYKIVKTGPEPKHARSQTVNRDPETRRLCLEAQEHNHALLRPRWRPYLTSRRWDYPIVIRRKIALGDVLLTTPIIRAIKSVQPLAQICVETDFPDILKNNPHVRQVAKSIGTPKDALIVDLNMAYENRTDIHILDAYMDVARAAVPALEGYEFKDRRLEMYPGPNSRAWAAQFRNSTAGRNGKLVLLHAGPTAGWAGKEYPVSRFAEMATWLVKKGCHVAVVGGRPVPQIKDALHLEGKTSLTQLAALCAVADLMVTIDSFPLHCGQAMRCPTVGIFGVTSSNRILTNTEKTIGIDGDPNDPHTGLRHKVTGRVSFTEGAPSIASISLGTVKSAVEKLLT